MSISSSILRLTDYYSRHGFTATMGRAGLAWKRALFAKRMAVFYCDLDQMKLPQVKVPLDVKVERVRSLTELSAEQLQEITSFWNPKLASRNVCERFEKGASLWLAKCEGRVAGYGWTLQGATIEPYYFPLAQNDVHLFDFHVFPHFRGRGVNPHLIGQILEGLASSSGGRAFIEAAEWNEAQLLSLRKTPFHCLGLVRSITIFGQTFVRWMKKDVPVQMPTGAKAAEQVLRAARSNE